jgi:tungstate transport system ATP-binding protein
MAHDDVLYRLESIRHQYGSRVVLDLEQFDVVRGETVAVVGPSGSGKSTLLRLLQFLERPGSGTITFEGRPVEGDPPLAVRRRVSTVFQRPVMLARSVRDNIAFGLRIRRAGTDGRITRLLESLDLASLANASARSLSGGEIQRVAIARALALDPDVILLDEPTANLDPRNVRLVEDLVRERRRTGVTVVLATHQIFQARRLADRTALLLDGRLVESGATASLMDQPQDPRTRAFLTGEMIY